MQKKLVTALTSHAGRNPNESLSPEIADRHAAFMMQIAEAGRASVPMLVYADHDFSAGHCVSCGVRLRDGHGIGVGRCEACRIAARLAVAGVPADEVCGDDEVREYHDQRHIGRFIAEACEPVRDAEVKATDLFEHYTSWADRQQVGDRLNATAFGRKAGEYFKKVHRADGTWYLGVARRQ